LTKVAQPLPTSSRCKRNERHTCEIRSSFMSFDSIQFEIDENLGKRRSYFDDNLFHMPSFTNLNVNSFPTASETPIQETSLLTVAFGRSPVLKPSDIAPARIETNDRRCDRQVRQLCVVLKKSIQRYRRHKTSISPPSTISETVRVLVRTPICTFMANIHHQVPAGRLAYRSRAMADDDPDMQLSGEISVDLALHTPESAPPALEKRSQASTATPRTHPTPHCRSHCRDSWSGRHWR
jgi:hypothetical protein